MEYKEVVLRMWPYYMLGIFMLIAAVKSGNKDLLRVNKKAVFKWIAFLLGISVYRYFMIKHVIHPDLGPVLGLPWQSMLTVFWEDAAHTLPLLMLSKLTQNKWFARPLQFVSTALIMAAFGSGHIYQGLFAAIFIMLYIPYTLGVARKHGLGTVMIGHTLYDLSTYAVLQLIARGF